MSEPNVWRLLHSTATTAIDVVADTYEMATVGEDATINFLRINSPAKPFLSIGNTILMCSVTITTTIVTLNSLYS